MSLRRILDLITREIMLQMLEAFGIIFPNDLKRSLSNETLYLLYGIIIDYKNGEISEEKIAGFKNGLSILGIALRENEKELGGNHSPYVPYQSN
jgi:hypothetical protein